jgi:serine protease AprX
MQVASRVPRYDGPLREGRLAPPSAKPAAEKTPAGVVDEALVAPAAAPPGSHHRVRPPHERYPIVQPEVSLEHAVNEPVRRGEFVPRLPGLDSVWAQGIKGKGQTIAVIDSGWYPNADVVGRVVAFHDFTTAHKEKPYDPDGHGTHVVGTVAGNGTLSHGKYQGVAPEANVVVLRIDTVAQAIEALKWVEANRQTYHIGVVNMSLGDCVESSYKTDPWCIATQKVIDSGVIVVAAAGNECCGPSEPDRCDLSICTPGNMPDIISVGAYDDKGTPQLDDDSLPGFTAHGPTPIDGLAKPDVVAPGCSVVSNATPGGERDKPDRHVDINYMMLSGTSQATPMVAGLAALMLSVNPTLTQAQVKDILRQTASNHLHADPMLGGAGLVQADKAVAMAAAMRSGSKPV